MKKTTFTLLVLLSCYHGLAAQCPTDITFSTQGQIDSFQINYPGCTDIPGSVAIQGSDISNLNGLLGIATIGGFLYIGNGALNTIPELVNDNLESLTGLDSLHTVGTFLIISANKILSNLSGLDNLAFIGNSLEISGNDSLTNISALEHLDSIPGDLFIGTLIDPPGPSSYIPYGNPKLTSLDGLENIQVIGGIFRIAGNLSLVNLTGLEMLQSIESTLDILHNSSLTSLSGLDSLTSVGGMWVELNPALTNLNSLDKLTSFGGILWVYGNDALTSLSGLGNVTTVGTSLIVSGNDALTSLNGLDHLTSIGGNLSVSGNDALTSLSSLGNLTSVSGYLRVLFNDALTSLSGLDNIDPATITDIYIGNNPHLFLCDVESVCNYLESGPATVSDNAPGCNTVPEIEAACQVPVKEVDENEQVRVFPNPTNGILYFERNDNSELTYRIRNSLGGLIRTEQLNSMGNVDISDLPNGLYLIEISIGNQLIIKRIVKTE